MVGTLYILSFDIVIRSLLLYNKPSDLPVYRWDDFEMSSKKGGKAFNDRQPNRNRIFRLVMSKDGISRQEIATSLKLCLPTVNQYLDHLTEGNLIRESGSVNTAAVGRKARAFSINPTARIALGMDITQHHIALVSVDLRGQVLRSVNERYVFSNTPESFAYLGKQIQNFIADNHYDRESILGLGISLPAIITRENTYVETITLLDGAHDFYEQLSQHLDIPIRLYNDANAGGFSELYSRHGTKRLIYLSLSHSIGGAIIENNRIIEGEHCRGGEFGHMTMVPNGEMCHCGQRGCANCYCSPDILAAYTDGDLPMFFRRLSDGDKDCIEVFERYLDYLAIFIHNINTCFDCDIVIGGGMSQYIAQYIDRLREMVHQRDSFVYAKSDFIKCCCYPVNASAVGSALFFIDAFVRSI